MHPSGIRLLALVPVLLCIDAVRSNAEDTKCFNSDPNTVVQRLGTKTPYRLLLQRDQDQVVDYEGCSAQRIWSMVRHGTRNPNRKTIRLIGTRLKALRRRIVETQEMCEADLDRFRAWHREVREDEQKYLVPEGVDELLGLARRMQQRYPSVMPDEYSNETYRFKFTDTQRTRKSFESFATGLFGPEVVPDVWHPVPMKRDPILRFYKLCKRWSVEVDKNPDTMAEVLAFRGSSFVRDAVRVVAQRSGLSDLTFDDVQLIYTACAFETAWDRLQASPWCSLFDEDAIKAFEFLEDLDYYHVDGYASRVTYEQACPALQDMIERLEPSSAAPRATFYFTHSGTILKLLAHLGLYRDDVPLTHDAFPTAEHRAWRVSRIDAFASNVAFVLYNCTSGPHLVTLHQERAVRLAGCPVDTDLCSLALFKSVFREPLTRCRFGEMCAIGRAKDEL